MTAKTTGSFPFDSGDKPYDLPFQRRVVAVVVLATAGRVGIVFNATRPTAKTSR